MKAEFWNQRWEANQLGFHQSEVNEVLTRWWPRLELDREAPVFVPLCGKSLDMRWLRAQGHPVVGVEFSPIAVRDFFAEAEIEPTRSRVGSLSLSEGGGYALYCGDFFELERAALSEVQAVYDRAALIALPPETRRRYARHLAATLPQNVQSLLISLEYDPSLMSGPPHSVPPAEVEALFGEDFSVERLWSSGPLTPNDHFRERGLDSWSETAWRLARSARA